MTLPGRRARERSRNRTARAMGEARAVIERYAGLERYLGSKLNNASLAAACHLSERTCVAVQLRTHLVPLSMIEGVVHVCAKLDVQAFVNSNILPERDIPIVLPGS